MSKKSLPIIYSKLLYKIGHTVQCGGAEYY